MFLVTGPLATSAASSSLLTGQSDSPHGHPSTTPAWRTSPTPSRWQFGNLDDPASVNDAAKGVEAIFPLQASLGSEPTPTMITEPGQVPERVAGVPGRGRLLEAIGIRQVIPGSP